MLALLHCFCSESLIELKSEKKLYVYDSFEGLPPKSAEDQSPAGEQFKTGELLATKRQLIDNFKRANLKVPHIHKGWFNEVPVTAVPMHICFAFLDGDYYDSIRDSLRLIEQRLVPGAIVVVDDYLSDSLPGAKRAVDEWAQSKGLRVRAQASLAIISV